MEASDLVSFTFRLERSDRKKLNLVATQRDTTVQKILLEFVDSLLRPSVPDSEQKGFRCVSPDTLHPIDSSGRVLFLENIDPSGKKVVLAIQSSHLEWLRMLADVLSDGSEKLCASLKQIIEGCSEALRFERERDRIIRGRNEEAS